VQDTEGRTKSAQLAYVQVTAARLPLGREGRHSDKEEVRSPDFVPPIQDEGKRDGWRPRTSTTPGPPDEPRTGIARGVQQRSTATTVHAGGCRRTHTDE
jgi:hypothetical protein